MNNLVRRIIVTIINICSAGALFAPITAPLVFAEKPKPLAVETFSTELAKEAGNKFSKKTFIFSNTVDATFGMQRSAEDPEEINCFEEDDSALIMVCDGEDLEKTREHMRRVKGAKQKRFLIVPGTPKEHWFDASGTISRKLIGTAMKYDWSICVVNKEPSPLTKICPWHVDPIVVAYEENRFRTEEVSCTLYLPGITQQLKRDACNKILEEAAPLELEGLTNERLFASYFLHVALPH